jgi:hypothetical protein
MARHSIDEVAIWFQLVDTQGNPFKQADVDCVGFQNYPSLPFFRETVQCRFNSIGYLKDVAPGTIRVYKTRDDFLNSARMQHHESFEGFGSSGDCPVLVAWSENQSTTSSFRKYVWIPHEPVYSVEKEHLFFVNRERAVHGLLEVIAHNHARAFGSTPDVGGDYEIALIDQLYGMGKTAFGLNFVNECKKICSSKTACSRTRSVVESVSRARTLHVNLADAFFGRFIHSRHRVIDFQNRVKYHMSISIENLEIPGLSDFLRPCIDSDTTNSVDLLRALIDVTGGDPVFVVLDEIGKAFEHSSVSVEDRRHLFGQFCSDVLGAWCRTKNLYFILLGRGGVLERVGNRLMDSGQGFLSPFKFKRLTLTMIRRDRINTILRNTTMINGGKRLVDIYGLDANAKVDEAIEVILKQTNGHPRSMLDMFRECNDQKNLLGYAASNEVKNEEWFECLIPYQRFLAELLEASDSGNEFDLMVNLLGKGMKSFSYADLADRAHIRWEGDLGRARLFVAPSVKAFLHSICSSFTSYIYQFAVPADVVLERDRILEIALIKRFQDFFKVPKSPENVSSSWFGGTNFGSLRNLQIESRISSFPKVTRQSSQITPLDFLAKTVHPAAWPGIRELLLRNGPACYLPYPKSKSSDGLIIAEATSGTEKIFVTIGIAAKCYKNRMSMSDIREELSLFDSMFCDRSQKRRKRAAQVYELNVLFICSTGGYPLSIQNRPGRKYALLSERDMEKCSGVTLAILLDLSSSKNRDDFFGLGDNEQAKKNLENIVNPQNC